MSSNLMVEEKIDPRIKRTLALLGKAFSDVLVDKGFQAMSVQDITEKAGVNRTTFYLHFADKYALLDYSISQLFREELDKRTLNICHYTPENLRSLIITVAEFVLLANTHCGRSEPQFEALVETQVKQQIQELLHAWGEKIAPGPETRTAAIAASWAIYGLSLEWSHNKKRSEVEEFAAQMLPLIQAILGLPEPEEAF